MDIGQVTYQDNTRIIPGVMDGKSVKRVTKYQENTRKIPGKYQVTRDVTRDT